MPRYVLILMGSDSDKEKMAGAEKALEHFGVTCRTEVASAHRNPEKVADLASTARERGYGAIICGAGLAAHLAGAVAAKTTLPVIGVPLSGGIAGGLDALLATVQMPPGIPVATVGVDISKNAGILAVELLAIEDDELTKKLEEFKAGGSKL